MAALALLASAGSAQAAHPHKVAVGCNHAATAKQGVGLAEAVWAPKRWERKGKPKPAAIRAHYEQVRCAAGPGHRAAIKKRWRADRRAFYRHRRYKLEESSYTDAITPPGLGTLEAIAGCESGGNPTAISPDGAYRGKYQFDYGTWASVGGSGDPAAAPEREQDERAAQLYRERGSSPWPICGI